jgi:site-specific DNA-methyltransferase (adenine-specific)
MKSVPRNVILRGDAAQRLSELLPQSIDCVISSPPYFRLRDYGVPGQLGQEESVAGWVENLRAVFRQLARVLKPHGSVWLNVGDGYSRHRRFGAQPKSLLLAPQRLVVALSADGWLVRNHVIFAKKNALPQSAADRLTPSHESLLFLTRSPQYYFDLDAIREPHKSANRAGKRRPGDRDRRYLDGNEGLGALSAAGRVGHVNGRNPGDVWWLPSGNYRGEHFATFPRALVERPLLSSCPERICVQCDRRWRRPTRVFTVHTAEGDRTVRKVGELARCDCFAPSRPGLVLDPFCGVGTVGLVAAQNGRDWIGIELNPRYAALADERLRKAAAKEAA